MLNRAIDSVKQNNIEDLKESIRELEKISHPSNTIIPVLKIKLAQLELRDEND